MRQLLLFGFVFFLAVLFAFCKKKTNKDGWEDTLQAGTIRIAGDESFKNMVDAAIVSFEAYSDYAATIFPIYSNEDEAIRLLTEDSVRLVVVSRDLDGKEQEKMHERRMVARKHLIAFEGIAFITNPTNRDSLIGLPTVKKILSGEITEWSQIYPKSPLGTIRVIFDSKQSSVLRHVADSIMKGEALSPNLYGSKNIDELIEKINELPNSLGVVGFNQINDVMQRKPLDVQGKFRMLRIGKEESATLQNTYLPYAGDLLSDGYPFWRPVYVLISDPRMGLSSGFSVFLANHTGQRVISKSGLLPAIMDTGKLSVNVVDGQF